MRNMAAVVPRLAALKATGVRIAIDDFGTGYSSLAYLQQFPVDTLKIDRSFISTMADSPESGALIRTLVQLGKTLGLETLAEGIEESEQYSQLQREQCDSGQGFLYARPLDVGAVETFLVNQSESCDPSTEAALPAPSGTHDPRVHRRPSRTAVQAVPLRLQRCLRPNAATPDVPCAPPKERSAASIGTHRACSRRRPDRSPRWRWPSSGSRRAVTTRR